MNQVTNKRGSDHGLKSILNRVIDMRTRTCTCSRLQQVQLKAYKSFQYFFTYTERSYVRSVSFPYVLLLDQHSILLLVDDNWLGEGSMYLAMKRF